jgi:hypothetical protein
MHCKSVAYCSTICTQAHIFDHECDEAPKPWLSPPVGPSVKPPDELGEEGFMGFLPWPLVRYLLLAALSWGTYKSYQWFDDFRCAAACHCVLRAGLVWQGSECSVYVAEARLCCGRRDYVCFKAAFCNGVGDSLHCSC